VLCEKPLAPTLEEACALATFAAREGRPLATGFLLRHHPAIVELRRRVRAGDVGRVRAIVARTVDFKRPRADGGCATNDAIHFVHLCAYLFDKPPRAAHAVVRDLVGAGQEDSRSSISISARSSRTSRRAIMGPREPGASWSWATPRRRSSTSRRIRRASCC